MRQCWKSKRQMRKRLKPKSCRIRQLPPLQTNRPCKTYPNLFLSHTRVTLIKKREQCLLRLCRRHSHLPWCDRGQWGGHQDQQQCDRELDLQGRSGQLPNNPDSHLPSRKDPSQSKSRRPPVIHLPHRSAIPMHSHLDLQASLQDLLGLQAAPNTLHYTDNAILTELEIN